jgi:hypothetical protein
MPISAENCRAATKKKDEFHRMMTALTMGPEMNTREPALPHQ